MGWLIRTLCVGALLAVPTVALASSSSGQVWVTTCTTEHYKPNTIVLACADVSNYLNKLKWSKWGTSSAKGKGTDNANNCSPSCAAGTFHKYPVSVVLSQPQHCAKQKHKVFNKLVVTYSAARPPDTPKTLKLALGCPY